MHYNFALFIGPAGKMRMNIYRLVRICPSPLQPNFPTNLLPCFRFFRPVNNAQTSPAHVIVSIARAKNLIQPALQKEFLIMSLVVQKLKFNRARIFITSGLFNMEKTDCLFSPVLPRKWRVFVFRKFLECLPNNYHRGRFIR